MADQRLSVERIEDLRGVILSDADNFPSKVYAEEINALCDMALRDARRKGATEEDAASIVASFLKVGSYLSHPQVRPWRGTANGDSEEAWNRDYAAALARALLRTSSPAQGSSGAEIDAEMRATLPAPASRGAAGEGKA